MNTILWHSHPARIKKRSVKPSSHLSKIRLLPINDRKPCKCVFFKIKNINFYNKKIIIEKRNLFLIKQQQQQQQQQLQAKQSSQSKQRWKVERPNSGFTKPTKQPSFSFKKLGRRPSGFLDTTTIISPNRRLKTKVFKKPMDRSSYLHNTSYHPNSLKTNIRYGQAFRLKICLSETDYQKALNEMKSAFLKSGYQENHLSKQFNKHHQRKDLICLPTKTKVSRKITNFYSSKPTIKPFQGSKTLLTNTGIFTRSTKILKSPLNKSRN